MSQTNEEEVDYRLGCEDEDERPIHPSCLDPNGECGCGRA